jgi:hypothetical protein
MTAGMISPGVVGAQSEYHYLAQSQPKGNWVVSAFRWDLSQRAWRLTEEDGQRLIWQSYTENDASDRTFTHPMLVAGDDLWSDYTIRVRFAPQSDRFQSGIVFRYHTSRTYYFAGVVGQHAVLKKVDNGCAFRKLAESILAEKACSWKPGEFLTLEVTAMGDRLTATFGQDVRLEACDGAFKHGKIGYTADVPTKYAAVCVTCSDEAQTAFEKALAARVAEEARLEAENPQLVLWKKIATPGFGTGRCLRFGDLDGDGRIDILVVQQNPHGPKDKLQPLWHLTLNTGHYPYAYDVNGDGKDELMVGYSLVNHDGKIIWSLEKQLGNDHADGVAIVSFKEGSAPRLQCVASDDGFFTADLQGHILEHLQLGHMQNPTIARFRPDLPGLQTVTVNFWGNQGIVNFFDADGKKYHDFEPAPHGSMMRPLNWKGDGQEYWILSPNPTYGGVYDGWGRRVMRFPADGHPDMCVATLALTGDCRDEIVVWDPWEIWIYTQSDNPKPGRLYKPRRNPLFNDSNYQTNVSLPGWSN